MTALDTTGPAPLYYQILTQLREGLESGRWIPGEKIPTEAELCAEYGVSRITVRHAVENLVEEGLLLRRQGMGTFAALPALAHGNQKPINSFHEACERLGKRPSTRVLFSGERPASIRDRKELQIRGDSNLVELRRLRMADGVPVVLETNRFSLAFSYLPDSDLNGSLYNLLRGYGVEAVSASHDLSLVFAKEEEAAALKITLGEPLLFLHEVVYDAQGRPIHNSDQYIRGDIFTLRI